MDVSKNRGFYPPNHRFVHRVFHYFHHPFWGVYHPYFWTHPNGSFPSDMHPRCEISRLRDFKKLHPTIPKTPMGSLQPGKFKAKGTSTSPSCFKETHLNQHLHFFGFHMIPFPGCDFCVHPRNFTQPLSLFHDPSFC